jgi:hypothetical protein
VLIVDRYEFGFCAFLLKNEDDVDLVMRMTYRYSVATNNDSRLVLGISLVSLQHQSSTEKQNRTHVCENGQNANFQMSTAMYYMLPVVVLSTKCFQWI